MSKRLNKFKRKLKLRDDFNKEIRRQLVKLKREGEIRMIRFPSMKLSGINTKIGNLANLSEKERR